MLLRLGVVAVLLAACGGPSAGSSTDSGAASGSEAASRASATATVADASLPPLPGGFPLPSGAEEAYVPASSSAIAAWTVDEEPPVIYDFYRSALADGGYDISLDAPGGEAAILRFTSADGAEYQLDLTGSAPVRIELGAPHD
jgi:hypothetical protein